TISDASRVLQGMLSALTYLHGSGITHNNIKPAKILYERQLGVILIGFGAATMEGNDTPVYGTPWFLPPEAALQHGRTRPSPATDIWALGVVMLFLLRRLNLGQEQQGVWSLDRVLADPEERLDVNVALAMWHQVIVKQRDSLAQGNTRLHRVVVEMLDADAEKRAKLSRPF
ncbi:kinase-like domain-containing protein, partial [Podospora australis]